MIHLSSHSTRYIAVRAEYRHKDTLKALAPWPDVQWDGEAKAWLVDCRLFDKLSEHLGSDFAPLDEEFLRTLPDAPAAHKTLSASELARARDKQAKKAKYQKRKVAA